MPAQSPTLSPTLSAIVAGCAGRPREYRPRSCHEVRADIGALGEDAAAQGAKTEISDRRSPGRERVDGLLVGAADDCGENPK